MKQIGVFLIFWLFYISAVSANDIVKIEYFFNSDPGYGNGIEIAIPTADSIINLDINLPIDNLPYGFNTAYLRALDNSGKWSLTSSRVFIKINTQEVDKEVKRIEYFLDSDPGYGNATPVAFTNKKGEINVDYTVDLSGLSKGFHYLYVRAQNNLGIWSITCKRSFYIFENESNHAINRIEYFIDSDPGQGNGTSLEFEEENEHVFVDHKIDIEGLENGFHKLYIRTKDASGAWSITSQRTFFIKGTERHDLPNITGIKYYFKNENFESETFLVEVNEPMPEIDSLFTADISSLPPDEEFTMYIYGVNEYGEEGLIQTKNIRACSTPPITADFGWISVSDMVHFADSSKHSTSFFWDFGNGLTDTVANPVISYEGFNDYRVTLVASNFCNTDTITKTISVATLDSLSISSAGNVLPIKFNAYGQNLNDSISKVSFRKDETIITADSIYFINKNELSLVVDLVDMSAGVYDVIFTQDNNFDTLRSYFEVINYAELPITGTVNNSISSNKFLYYKFQPPEDALGSSLNIILDEENDEDISEIYVSFNASATPDNYQFKSSITNGKNMLTIPALQDGYYLMIVKGNTEDDHNVSLSTEIPPFEIFTVHPAKGGNTGHVTLKLTGVQYDTLMNAALINGYDTIRTHEVFFRDRTVAFARFDLSGKNLGDYKVMLEKYSGAHTEIAGVFEVVQGVPENLVTNMTSVATTRWGFEETIMVTFKNEGNTDIFNYVAVFKSVNGSPISMSEEDLENEEELFFYIQHPESPFNTLRPDDEFSIPLFTIIQSRQFNIELLIIK